MALDGHFSHLGLYKATGPSNSSVQNQDRDREQLPTSQTMIIIRNLAGDELNMSYGLVNVAQ